MRTVGAASSLPNSVVGASVAVTSVPWVEGSPKAPRGTRMNEFRFQTRGAPRDCRRQASRMDTDSNRPQTNREANRTGQGRGDGGGVGESARRHCRPHGHVDYRPCGGTCPATDGSPAQDRLPLHPRAPAEPIVREAPRPVLERLGSDVKPEQILELKVLDPAEGSRSSRQQAGPWQSAHPSAAALPRRSPAHRPRSPADRSHPRPTGRDARTLAGTLLR